MQEAARASCEAEGMVFCLKLGGMGEKEYLFSNAYNSECQNAKRECCVPGQQESRTLLRKKNSVVSLDKDHAFQGSDVLVCWDPTMQEIPVGSNPSLEFCPRCKKAFPIM